MVTRVRDARCVINLGLVLRLYIPLSFCPFERKYRKIKPKFFKVDALLFWYEEKAFFGFTYFSLQLALKYLR